jgi:hypothetical protein
MERVASTPPVVTAAAFRNRRLDAVFTSSSPRWALRKRS